MEDTIARTVYVDVEYTRLPLVLARLHQAVDVGAALTLTFRITVELAAARDTRAADARLLRVVRGAGFDLDENAATLNGPLLEVSATRARTLPDFVARDMRILVCGLNPSVYAADAGVGFARPGNRFWPAALAAGLVSRDRDPFHALTEHHVGMTDLVKRATPRADALTRSEYAAGAARVEQLTRWLRPNAVCFVGLTGWRAAVDPKAKAGEQPEGFGGRPAYLMPNTSGINARVSLDKLTNHFRAALALARRQTSS